MAQVSAEGEEWEPRMEQSFGGLVLGSGYHGTN